MQVVIAVPFLRQPAAKDVAGELALPHKPASVLLAKLSELGLVEAKQDLRISAVKYNG